jgi:soluble lytic murein transglycosylase
VFVVGGALLVGLGGGLLIANRDELEETFREVTLPLRHDDIIRQQAEEKDVPPDLIAAVIYRESKFRDQTSSAGARGLMQITPETAVHIAREHQGDEFETDDLSDPDINIRYGTRYLRDLLDRYEGNQVAALAAYNAGPSNVEEWGGSSLGVTDIRFPDTREYVEDVLEKRSDYARHYSDELGLD